MNKGPPENEKVKKAEEASEEEGLAEPEGQEAENAEEGPELEEALPSEKSVPPFVSQTAGSSSVAKSEQSVESATELQKRRQKWMTLTGRKPRNIPTIRRYCDADPNKIILFGDRRQIEVDKKIAEKMALAAKRLNTKARNLGKVRKEIWLPALCNGLMCIRFEPTAHSLSTADRNGGIQVRKPRTGEIMMELKTIEASEKLAIRSLRYHPKVPAKLYAAGETGFVQVFSKNSAALLNSSENLSLINCMDISFEGGFLVTGGRDGKIHILDPTQLKVISKRVWPQLDESTPPEIFDQFHRLRVYGVKFHPEDENTFVTGSYDSVKIWDVRVPAAVRSINGPAIFGDGLDMSGNTLLTAAWQAENSIGLWDLTSGKLIKYVAIKNHYTKLDGEFLFTGQFFRTNPAYPAVNSNLIAVGGGGFNQLLVINIKNERVLAHFPSYKAVFCMDLAGNMVAYGGKESVYRIGEVEEYHRD